MADISWNIGSVFFASQYIAARDADSYVFQPQHLPVFCTNNPYSETAITYFAVTGSDAE
jgi:hypothetical protein